MAMLKVMDLSVTYGHVRALKKVHVEADEGQIVSIIGSNGAGKTSLLRTISGLVKPVEGTIEFLGEPIPSKSSKIVAKGIVHVPEGRKTFSASPFVITCWSAGIYIIENSWKKILKSSLSVSLF